MGISVHLKLWGVLQTPSDTFWEYTVKVEGKKKLTGTFKTAHNSISYHKKQRKKTQQNP